MPPDIRERLRIAVVTPMLPVDHDPTQGRFTYETVRALARVAEVRTFFQTMRYPAIPGAKARNYLHRPLAAGYRLPDLDVDAYDYLTVPLLTRAVNGLLGSRALGPRARAFRPDVVLGYWVYPDGAAALRVARSLGVPCVIGALGSDIHRRAGPVAWLTRRTLIQADAVITVSEAMRRTAITVFGVDPAAVHAVVNGVDRTVFRPMDRSAARRRLGVGETERLVVYVGRFIAGKGMGALVDASRQLAAADPRFRLALVGDGVMRSALLAQVERAGLTGRVYLPGGLAPGQVAQWIAASDVLALPSWSEGYPNVVVEAIACGRPVVATDVGGTREIVHAGNGILIPPRDAAALRDGLARSLARDWDPDRLAAGMTRSWDDVAAETRAICAAQLAHRRPHAVGGEGS